MSTVSENIKYLRKLKGYTQEQFAERIGIKRSLVGAYEEARANPKEIYLDSMAEVLGVEVEHLLHENLKEKGRKLGAGMILKLNPSLPEAEPKSERSMENQVMESATDLEDGAITGAQMDLFGSAVRVVEEPLEQKMEAVSVPARSTSSAKGWKEESQAVSNTDFLKLIEGLLSTQEGYRLFMQPDDIPLNGTSVVGKRLHGVESVLNDHLYIIVTRDDQVLFRRAFNQLAIKGTLILSSDFPEKPTIELKADMIKEVYQYLGSFQTSPPSAVAPVQKLKLLTEEMMKVLNHQ